MLRLLSNVSVRFVTSLKARQSDADTKLGVAVSYLIIIGDLMPQVMLGFNEGLVNYPFIVDRHFWVTAFMLVK